jgi:hypothetical protein
MPHSDAGGGFRSASKSTIAGPATASYATVSRPSGYAAEAFHAAPHITTYTYSSCTDDDRSPTFSESRRNSGSALSNLTAASDQIGFTWGGLASSPGHVTFDPSPAKNESGSE